MKLPALMLAVTMVVSVTGHASAQVLDSATTMDVLDKYSALLQDKSKGVVRNISELPYSKTVIKQVLQDQMLRPDVDARMRGQIEVAYLFLASFQKLTGAEDEAVHTWDELVRTGSAITDEKELARRISAVGDTYTKLSNKVDAEKTQLYNEIRSFEKEHNLSK